MSDGGNGPTSLLELVRIFDGRRAANAPPPADRVSELAATVLARDAARRVLAGKLRGTDMVDFDVEGAEA